MILTDPLSHGLRRQGFDVALLRDCHIAVPQNDLDGLVITSQSMLVGCQAAPKSVPAFPFWHAFIALIFMVT